MSSAILGALLALTAPTSASELSVSSTPPGGAAYVDDRHIGTTPLTVDLPTEGEHLLRVEKAGFAPWRGVITLGAEAAIIEAALAPEPEGSITVNTDPKGADVFVDGALVGRSPAVARGLSLGRHQVQASKPGYRLATQDIELTGEQPDATYEPTLSGRVEEYLVAHVEAHPEDVMAMTDLAHEYALRKQFDACLETLGRAFDEVATRYETLDQDEIRRVYQEVERLDEAQYSYATADEVAALRPKLVEALRAGIERHPDNGFNYESLGDILKTLGQTDEALATYQQGAAAAATLPSRIRLMGDAGQILYARAQALYKTDDWPAALAAYRLITEAMPKHWCASNAWIRIIHIQRDKLDDPSAALAAVRGM